MFLTHGNKGCTNALHRYVITYIACLVYSVLVGCSVSYKPIHVSLFFYTIILLFLDLFCAVLLLAGCNLSKACKTDLTHEYNEEDAGISLETRMTKRKLRIVKRQLTIQINSTFSLSVCLLAF